MSHRVSWNRAYWALFLATFMGLALLIRWHVWNLDREVSREGLANTAIICCRSVLVDHVDVETGLRGYLITGRREYLRPYHEGLGRLDRDMADLRVAVTALPNEVMYFESVAAHSRDVLTEFSNQVAISDSDSIESGRARFQGFPTKPGMDKIRLFLLAIQSEEDRRLAANMATLERSLATTLFLIDAFAVISGLLLVAMAFGLVKPPDSASNQPTG
jgi:methyl-accepting chemotaxis protein